MIRTLFVDRTRSTWIQLFRYLFVGGFAAAVDTGSLMILHQAFGLHHLKAAAIGFLFGLTTNYLISVAWVFESSGRVRDEFLLFAVIGIGGLGLTEMLMWAGVDLAGLPVLPAKLIALVLVLGWNFGLRKKLVFGRSVG